MTNPNRERADQSVSSRFTRVMNATTSRYGILTDPPIVALLSSIGLVVLLATLRQDLPPIVSRALAALALLPIAVAVVVSIALRGARRRVVDWLAGIPFPVENMNAVLNGLGEMLEVNFKQGGPTSAELNAKLDEVHADCFVTKVYPEEGVVEAIELRIGVVDSKRNPSASNHRRYLRVREIVERVLVPLSAERYPITSVRVK